MRTQDKPKCWVTKPNVVPGGHVGESTPNSSTLLDCQPLNIWRSNFRLLREAVAAPSLEVFKAKLGEALGNVVWCEVSLHMAGG